MFTVNGQSGHKRIVNIHNLILKDSANIPHNMPQRSVQTDKHTFS